MSYSISPSRRGAIRTAIEADQVMTALKQIILHGWPEERSHLPTLVHPYFAMRDEITVYDGIVFQDERVFVPASHSGKTRSAPPPPPPNGCWPVRLWLMDIIEDAIIYFELNDFLPAVHVLVQIIEIIGNEQ